MDICNKRDLNSETDLVNVLDNIIRTANEHNDDGIIKFAILQIDSWNYRQKLENNRTVFDESTVHFPHCISYVVKIVIWILDSKKVDEKKWKDICHLIIKTHASLGHDSEVTWACWLLKHLNLNSKFTKTLLSVILQKGSAFPALIAVDLAESESATMLKEARRLVSKRLSNHPMKESDWLLAYECKRLFGFPFSSEGRSNNSGGRSDKSVFQYLLQQEVQFYSKEIQIDPWKDNKPSTEKALDDFGALYDDVAHEFKNLNETT